MVLLFARVVLGCVMVYYGWPKVRSLRSNARDFVGMGFRPGWLFGTIVAFTEFVGGILLILGLATGPVAALFGFQMILGTFWKIKIGRGFSDWSYDMLALALALTIMVGGGGVFSVACSQNWFLRWDVALGVVTLAMVAAVASDPEMKK